MVKVTVTGNIALDMRAYDFSGIYDGSSYYRTSSIFRANYSDGTGDEFRGSGLRYNGNGEPIDGTVTSYSILIGGKRAAMLEGTKIAATEIVKVARTSSTADDGKLIQKIFAGNDTISGGKYNDVVYGHNGNDNLTGGAGNDTLSGGAGSDKLYGGTGADKLYGGTGNDTFIFKSVADSRGSAVDTIYDFSRSQGDKIDLRSIDARSATSTNDPFTFIKSEGFHKKAGELRYEQKGGATFVHGDINADGRADFTIKFNALISFIEKDFLL